MAKHLTIVALHARALVVAGAVSLAMAGCMVGPNYTRPSAPTPTQYKASEGWKVSRPADTIPKGTWWEVYNDPDLNALESQVDVSNQNIAIYEARVRQARAQVQAARAALFPVVGVTGSGSRTGAAQRSGSASFSTGSGGVSGGSGPNNSFNVALDASWELDLWGRVRRQIEAARATAQATEGDLGAARLSAQSDLAQDYFMLRLQDAQIDLLNQTVGAYAKSYQLTQNQYNAGVVARADLLQAETQLKSTQAQLVDARLTRTQTEYAIALLVGKPPAELDIAARALDVRVPSVPLAVPSELLERRPDIAAAERRAAAANAQIGVAEAAFFPTVSLSATGGFQSSTLSRLLSLPSRYWTLGADLAATLFDAGLRAAQTEAAIGAYDEQVANYRQTVLSSFQEVETNLVAMRILEEESAVQDEAVRAARQSTATVLNQYRAGIVSYLNVIIAQTAQLSNERAALTIMQRRMVASAVLIKALGGGWSG